MPSRALRALVVAAIATGALPLAVLAGLEVSHGELRDAALSAGGAALIAAPLLIRRLGWFRAVCLLTGMPIFVWGTLFFGYGGFIAWPASLALLAAGAMPARWPAWKGLLAAAVAVPVVIAVLIGG